MAKQKKIIYYFVPDGWGGQASSDIKEVEMTKDEYQAIMAKPRYQREGAYFKKYIEALYYTLA